MHEAGQPNGGSAGKTRKRARRDGHDTPSCETSTVQETRHKKQKPGLRADFCLPIDTYRVDGTSAGTVAGAKPASVESVVEAGSPAGDALAITPQAMRGPDAPAGCVS